MLVYNRLCLSDCLAGLLGFPTRSTHLVVGIPFRQHTHAGHGRARGADALQGSGHEEHAVGPAEGEDWKERIVGALRDRVRRRDTRMRSVVNGQTQDERCVEKNCNISNIPEYGSF
ncbi:hypothetical protein EVAR_82050_1 [Eumeta japonica]|uniref:Uncharacterized protein n=1 Tax=Eumeta variegata TaxID=151549 RepID=A0A4C1XKQ3_EUMVA|nr:hypothetical protein EVAR_82050_1 [Eumeta japonica]